MKYLARLCEHEKIAEGPTPLPSKPTKPGFDGFEGAHLGHFENHGTESGPSPADRAHRAVVAQLEKTPDIERAFVNRWEGDVMIVTLAVRGIGTCELSIPRERFGADSLEDYDRLAACILNAEGPT